MLAATLPTYRLPKASVAHTRHFMPTGVLEKGREKTTLVFDTFADVADGTVAIRWDCVAEVEGQALFERLASHLGYLGRSESWVEAEAISDDAPLPPGDAAFPHADGQRAGHGWEQVSLMAPEPPDRYRTWRDEAVASALEALDPTEGRKRISKALEKKRAKAEAPYPADLIDCLQRDTAWWKGHRWSQPPGSRRVLYWRRSDALTAGTPTPAIREQSKRLPMMLLALSTPGGSRSALPPRTRSLPQAELLHRALVAHAGRGNRTDCPELTGKDEGGAPLKGHRHAHLLPLDLDGDGYLDHVLLFARMGLGPDAQRAVRRLKRTWTKGGIGELRVALAGQGELHDLRGLPESLRSGIAALLGPENGARVWTSATPLVLPRYLKRSGRNTLQGQVVAELAARDLPEASVEVLAWNDETRDLRHTIRVRQHPAKRPPMDAGFAVRLRFADPVKGPITLGYASHFGLGLFFADENPDR
jgi:CRISPR-associated protein Csb2